MIEKISKRTITAFILLAATFLVWLCCMSATRPAHADMGPKESVTVTIENIKSRVCYGTLLSYYENAGPHHTYSPDNPDIPPRADPESEYFDEEVYDAWKAFIEYNDPDGYYFLQIFEKCDKTGEISWDYYPPSKFKVLLYFPETQTFVSSGIYEQYAFHSYFTATLSDTDFTGSRPGSLTVHKSYNYTWEIVSLLVRIIVTMLIELGVAWLFRLRTKKKILSIIIVNAVTQTAMNIVLNVLTFYQNIWGLFWYIPIELAVFAVEAVAYSLIFGRTQVKMLGADGNITANPEYVSTGKCVLYSLAANILSFIAGFVLILVIPGIF